MADSALAAVGLATIRAMTLATVHPELADIVPMRHSRLAHEEKLHEALRLISEALLDNHAAHQQSDERHSEQYETVVRRFSEAVTTSETWRRKYWNAQDDLQAKNREIEAKGRQIMNLQNRVAQLEEALRNPLPDNIGFRELDRLVRTAPTRRG